MGRYILDNNEVCGRLVTSKEGNFNTEMCFLVTKKREGQLLTSMEYAIF